MSINSSKSVFNVPKRDDWHACYHCKINKFWEERYIPYKKEGLDYWWYGEHLSSYT